MNNEWVLRMVLGAIFLGFFGITARYRHRSEQQGERLSWRGEGWFVMVFLRVFGGLAWLSVVGYLLVPSVLSWAQVSVPWEVRWVGVLVTACMGPCLVWVFRHIGNNVTQTVETRKNHQLITTGPYRWIRHPLYSFGILYFLGFSLAAANVWILSLALLAFVMLLVRLPKEEEKLIEAFGENYLAYKKKTGGLFPKFW